MITQRETHEDYIRFVVEGRTETIELLLTWRGEKEGGREGAGVGKRERERKRERHKMLSQLLAFSR